MNTRLIAIGAGIIFSLDFVSYHSAIDWVGTGIGTLIGNSQVIIVTLMSWWLFGEKPNLSIIISLPIVMFGLFLISGIWDDEPYGSHPGRGVIAGVFTAIFYSGFLIIYRFANRDLAPATNLQFDSTVGCAFGLLFLSFLPLQTIHIEPIDFQPTWPIHGWLLLLAILSQVVGWLAIAYSLPRLPAAYTSFAILLQPVLTIIWGVILLSESPSPQQSVGMFLILGSIIGVTIYGSVEESSSN
jgi:drug/metabolite transporter (DMT)-like permease